MASKQSQQSSQLQQEALNLINSQRNIELLTKHTIQYFLNHKQMDIREAKQSTKKLLQHYASNLFGAGGLSQFIGSVDFTYFNLYYLQDLLVNGDDKAPLSPTHYDIWNELEKSILIKDYNQRNYICPRGFGKTTTISIPLTIWVHIYEYKNYTVLASAVSSTAQQFLASIKTTIQDNIYLAFTFGQLIDSKKYTVNSEKLQLTNRSAIESISASGSIRGKQNELTNKRIELLICDDYQNADQTRTEEARNNKWMTFNSDAKNALQKDNSLIVAVGTVQNNDCFYSRLIKSPTWKSRVEHGVLIDDVDEYFNSGHWLEFKNLLNNPKDDNRLDTAKEYYLTNYDSMQFKLLWDYWSCLDYALMYYENKQSFMQEVQNDTTASGEKRFKTIITESAEEIESHDYNKTVLTIDPASTNNKGNKKDFYAFVVGSMTDSKIKYIRSGEIFKYEFDDYMNHTIELLKKYDDITTISIEKNTYSGADVIKLQEIIANDELLKHKRYTWINDQQTTNKDFKINSIVGAVNLGQIVFNEANKDAIGQLREFVGAKLSKHDDFPDCLAECVMLLDKTNVIKPISISPNWFR